MTVHKIVPTSNRRFFRDKNVNEGDEDDVTPISSHRRRRRRRRFRRCHQPPTREISVASFSPSSNSTSTAASSCGRQTTDYTDNRIIDSNDVVVLRPHFRFSPSPSLW